MGPGRVNGHQNAGSLSSWEGRLNAREEALRRREQAVSAAEGQAGVRALTSLTVCMQSRAQSARLAGSPADLHAAPIDRGLDRNSYPAHAAHTMLKHTPEP